MGIKKEQVLKMLGISKNYHDKELADLESRMNTLIQTLYDAATGSETNKLHLLTENVGLQDTPVGHILTYMGKTAPSHYLACDGTIYNITDYPLLATHILNEFGTVNYFGGDGETTFAVPDLRGEFLRGSGTNSHAEQGSGADVGNHQDGTSALNLYARYGLDAYGGQDVIGVQMRPGAEERAKNFDSAIGELCDTNMYISSTSVEDLFHYSTSSWQQGHPVAYTSRPTNTSVLYCIKYEPTYYLRAGSDKDYYMDGEHCIGVYRGDPLYRMLYDCTVTSSNQSIVISDPWVDNVNKFVTLSGICVEKSGAVFGLPNLNAGGLTYSSGFFLTNKTINIRFGSGVSLPAECTITFIYTKK